MTVTCPHCRAANPAGSAFCESCGKALPTAAPTGPRVVSADQLPASAGATRMVSDELVKQQKSASTALIAVGIIAALAGVVMFVLSNNVRGEAKSTLQVVGAVQLGLAVIFVGLYIWSRKSPLPASIAGLCVYGTMVVINVAVRMTQISRGGDAAAGGIGVGILDIIIIAVLVRAILAGLKHRRLVSSMGGRAAA